MVRSANQRSQANKKKHFTLRMNVFFFGVFLFFTILIIRLAMMQFVHGDELVEKKINRMKANIPIPPVRGNIYDRQGYPIAQSLSTESLYFKMEPGQDPKTIIATAKKLAVVFARYGDHKAAKPLSASDIVNLMDTGYDIHLKNKPIIGYAFSPRRIKTDLSDREIAYFTEHRDEIKSIEVMEESIREYDKQSIAVQLVGYLREYRGVRESYDVKPLNNKSYLETETVGFDGIEYMYQNILRGTYGRKIYPINASGKIIPGKVITEPSVKGDNLYLTIDKDVQLTAEEAITKHLVKIKTDPLYRAINHSGVRATAGYAVAIEVKTGKVIAMASMPDYSPDVWRGGRISGEDLQKITNIYGNGTIKQNWANYQNDRERGQHPGSLVPLGSTMKPLTVLIGLNEKLFGVNTVYHDTGKFVFGKDGSKISNSDGHAYGNMTAADAIFRSSNTFMSEMIGSRLYKKYGANAVQVWDRYVKAFGLGVSTQSGLRGEINGLEDYSNTKVTGSNLASMVFASFGQAGSYTPLQLAQYAATLGSHGKRMKPLFVSKIESPEGRVVKTIKPKVLNTIKFPQAYWDAVENGMFRVRRQGFENITYKVAAKTGTSQMSVAGKIVENAVFIAYAPMEKPKLAVAVVVPEGGFGAWGAAPIARKIFDAYDKSVGLADKGPGALTNPGVKPIVTPNPNY
jgi:penicillin-binding protein 2